MSLHQQDGAGQELSLPRMFGRYLLVERLSRGGMGEIFLARHGLSGFEKLAVIKKILPNLSADPEFLSRFIDEAQVAVQLQHANIAQVFEVGRVDDEYFLSIEYIDGRDLRATMVRLAEQQKAMPVDLALYVAREAANGLAYAHRRTDDSGTPLAVVHCDISPPNLVLSYDGEVKIIDFGIARSAVRITETNPNRGFGKFGYLAPEQLLKGATVDFRTDIYAVGVVLYEMLTGRRMFEVGPNPDYRALARTVVKGLHPLPSSVNPALAELDELVATALRPKPEDRYQSAADFRDEIQRALVKVNPTTNADHLGELITEQFPGWQERRRELAEIDKTDLDRWQRELEGQVGATVSFARSGSSDEVHAAEQSVEGPHSAERDTTPTPRHAIAALSQADLVTPAEPVTEIDADDLITPGPDRDDDEDDVITDEKPGPSRPVEREDDSAAPFASIAASAKPPMRLGLLVAVVVLLAGVAGAVVWWTSRTSAGVDAGSDASYPVVTPLDAAAALAQPADAAPAMADAAPAMADASVRRPSETRRTRRSKRSRRNQPAATEPADAASVRRHFRRARRDYQSFKAKYGARLESQWNELAQMATYAKSPAQLAELDQKIRAFRSRLADESK